MKELGEKRTLLLLLFVFASVWMTVQTRMWLTIMINSLIASTGRLWIAGTYGINKKPFNKKIIQEIGVKSEAIDFVTLVNGMSYSLRVAATLLRGLMLIYDKQWVYLGKYGLEFFFCGGD